MSFGMTAATVALLRNLFAAILACTTCVVGSSPGPHDNWTPTSVTQEAQLASLVFTGTVVTPTTKEALESFSNFTVDVHVDSYLRGCGPTLVALRGFVPMSGEIMPPKVGQKLIAFACIAGDASASMNRISDYCGAKIEDYEDIAPHVVEAREALGLPDTESNITHCASEVLLSNHTCRRKPSPTKTEQGDENYLASHSEIEQADENYPASHSVIRHGLGAFYFGAMIAASLWVVLAEC